MPVGLGGGAVAGQTAELVADLLDRQPDVGRGADEGEASQDAALEAALAASRAVRLDQSLGLVEADRRRGETAAAGDLAHRQQVSSIHPKSPELKFT